MTNRQKNDCFFIRRFSFIAVDATFIKVVSNFWGVYALVWVDKGTKVEKVNIKKLHFYSESLTK